MGRRQRIFRNRLGQDCGGMNPRTPRALSIISSVTAIVCLLFAIASTVHGTNIPLDQRRSGYLDLGHDSKAMQDDDTINLAKRCGIRKSVLPVARVPIVTRTRPSA